MARKKSIHLVHFDGTRKFALAVAGVTLLGVGFAGGLVMGRRFPAPVNGSYDEPATIAAGDSVVIDAPIPSQVYSFYSLFEPGTGSGAASVPPAPLASAPAEPVAAEASGVLPVEPLAMPDGLAVAPDGIPAVAEAVLPGDQPAIEPAPVAPAAEPDDAIAAPSAPRADAIPPRPSAPSPAVEREANDPEPAREVTLAAPAEEGTTRRVSRGRGRPPGAGTGSAGQASEELVVASSESMDAAEAQRASLRNGGLQASVRRSGSGGYEVVVLAPSAPAEQARQRQLARRLLGE
jgi:hypothetical protein